MAPWIFRLPVFVGGRAKFIKKSRVFPSPVRKVCVFSSLVGIGNILATCFGKGLCSGPHQFRRLFGRNGLKLAQSLKFKKMSVNSMRQSKRPP